MDALVVWAVTVSSEVSHARAAVSAPDSPQGVSSSLSAMVVTWHEWTNDQVGTVRCFHCGEVIPGPYSVPYRITWIRVGYGNAYLQMGQADAGVSRHLYYWKRVAYAALCKDCLSRFCIHGLAGTPTPEQQMAVGLPPRSSRDDVFRWLRTFPMNLVLDLLQACMVVLNRRLWFVLTCEDATRR